MRERRKFLLVRLDGVGDALACVPSLEALREACPGAEFGAICSPANAALFDRSLVPAVHVMECPRDEPSVGARLRTEGYTDALVATEEPVGYRLARASGARRRAGFWHKLEKPFKSLWQFAQLTDAVYRPAAWVAQPEHEVEAIHRLALRLGAAGSLTREPSRLRRWLRVAGSGRPEPNAMLLQVAPKWLRGGWEPGAIAGVIYAAVAASSVRRCVIACAPSDAGLAAAIMEHLPPAAIADGTFSCAPPSDMSDWLGTIAAAAVVVSPDTGAAHAAGMLGVPVVDVFEADRFEQLSQQWRPWASPSRCIVKPPFAQEAPAVLASRIAGALASLAASQEGR